jgi:fumarylacetoacetate (FAA) hydrolase family protein
MGLVLDGKGNIVGHTLANDVSIWGIERENPLYLRNRRSTRGR